MGQVKKTGSKGFGGWQHFDPSVPKPPALSEVEITYIPTVGDIGLDFVILYRFNEEYGQASEHVVVEMTAMCNATCTCTRHNSTSFVEPFLQGEGFGEMLLQNQQMVRALGSCST